MICARCHRVLTRTPIHLGGMSFGPKCATAVAGSRPRRAGFFNFQRPRADARQRDLFTEGTP
jgi:hypothetical protein